tara:strand:+ start:110 stop:379 length:270 start_codon:yes stop_codon:yes gene_type:complete
MALPFIAGAALAARAIAPAARYLPKVMSAAKKVGKTTKDVGKLAGTVLIDTAISTPAKIYYGYETAKELVKGDSAYGKNKKRKKNKKGK